MVCLALAPSPVGTCGEPSPPPNNLDIIFRDEGAQCKRMTSIALSVGNNGHGALPWWRPSRFANCALAKLAPCTRTWYPNEHWHESMPHHEVCGLCGGPWYSKSHRSQ